MKKNIASIILPLLILLPFLAGMSSLSGQSPEKVPVPAKKFTATVIDQTDMITDLRDVSINGGTFLEGKRGEGTAAISFDNIYEVSFRLDGEKLSGSIKLRDGNAVELMLDRNQRAYGHTKYGTFQIKLSDIKKITISKAQ